MDAASDYKRIYINDLKLLFVFVHAHVTFLQFSAT